MADVPFLNWPSLRALKADHERLRYTTLSELGRLRHFFNELNEEGGGAAVAVTDTIIPARIGDTPGGPITVTIHESFNPAGSVFSDGFDVPVYSWVQTDSADPADQPNNELFIFIAQDNRGTWWFIAQDCTLVPAEVVETASTANTTADLTVQELQLPGSTDLTLSHEGVYQYSLKGELIITGVAGNQYWEVGVGVYNETDASFMGIRDFSGTGTPVQPTWNFSISLPLTVTAADVGDILIIACQRTTTTGTVVVNSGTGHALLGPLK